MPLQLEIVTPEKLAYQGEVDSVQLPAVATPLVLVLCDGPVSTPFVVPGAANVTAAPKTGLPLASRTSTDGGIGTAVPAGAAWLLPPFTAIWVAVPAVTVTVLEVMPVSVPEAKLSVRGPTVPVMVSPLNAAAPLALVRTAVTGASDPPPDAIAGVTEGFKRELDIVGVGYRAEVKGKQVIFALGYSHAVVFDIPAGIDVAIDKQTHITVTGVDRQLVGQVAANIRRLRKPDPYKQKGVRYTGEVLKKKAGKTGAK